MCSGYMWNTIRQPPFIAMGRDGKPMYFAAGFQQQYGVETVVVAIYSVISFSFIAMTVLAPKMPAANLKGVVYAGLLTFLFAYSMILFVFRMKNGQYPYKLVLLLNVAVLIKQFDFNQSIPNYI
jgi:oligosaccharyltransferase complex subunit gamma